MNKLRPVDFGPMGDSVEENDEEPRANSDERNDISDVIIGVNVGKS
jgi:hypothetical protein